MTFDEFVESQLPPLLRYAKVLCGERELAEDVLQDVLLRASRRWEEIGVLDRPHAYVRKMITNEFLSWRRKWARITPVGDVPDVAVPDHAAAHAVRADLVGQLARLPRRQRAVIVLRFYGGLSDTEIAEELVCTVGTVRSHVSRALRSMRVELAEESADVLKEV